MDLKKAEELVDEFPDWVAEGELKNEFRASATGAIQTVKWFISTLYANGHRIISKEEWLKLNINVKHST